MNLNQLSNNDLHAKLITLSAQERQITAEILRYLEEVQNRRLYAEMGYSSLFDFCLKELCMSEANAGRKIASMRLLKELPEVQTKVEDGTLNLSTLSMTASFFNKEKKAGKLYKKEDKIKILTALEGKSKKQVEQKLIEKSPLSLASMQSQKRQLNDNLTRLSFVFTREQLQKLYRLKELKGEHISDAEIFNWLMERVLKQIDPLQKKTKKVNLKKELRYIPATLKKEVHLRDNGQCQYVDPESGRQCTSRSNLHIDHKRPVALGGYSELKNLRLLCPEHNRLMAIKSLGRKKMRAYMLC